jgi:hypothetical protein
MRIGESAIRPHLHLRSRRVMFHGTFTYYYLGPYYYLLGFVYFYKCIMQASILSSFDISGYTSSLQNLLSIAPVPSPFSDQAAVVPQNTFHEIV